MKIYIENSQIRKLLLFQTIMICCLQAATFHLDHNCIGEFTGFTFTWFTGLMSIEKCSITFDQVGVYQVYDVHWETRQVCIFARFTHVTISLLRYRLVRSFFCRLRACVWRHCVSAFCVSFPHPCPNQCVGEIPASTERRKLRSRATEYRSIQIRRTNPYHTTTFIFGRALMTLSIISS